MWVYLIMAFIYLNAVNLLFNFTKKLSNRTNNLIAVSVVAGATYGLYAYTSGLVLSDITALERAAFVGIVHCLGVYMVEKFTQT